MDSSQSDVIVYILFSLGLSAFFSGVEIAFLSANKLKIELNNQKGSYTARILSFFYKRPSRFIGAMLVGNNIALVVYGILMGQVITKGIITYAPIIEGEGLILFIQTIITTIIILIAAEFLPKAIFRINPNFILKILAVPLLLIYLLLFIPTMITVGASEFLLKIVFRVKLPKVELAFGKIDLDHYVKEMAIGAKDKTNIDHEIQIFQNALDFGKVKARDCMVPRTDIVALEMESSMEVLTNKFIETGLSKILVYRESIDNIIGYAHSYDLFRKPDELKNTLMPLSIVPETMPANEVMELLIKQKRSAAIVMDEFGGTAGMITVEDIVEEIFGEIEDEHDGDDWVEKQLSENEYLFSGRLEINYINEKYGFKLQNSDEYDTLAGWILAHTESIPEINSKIVIDLFVIHVVKATEKRIDEIKLKKLPND
ncbi:MAG: putative hemolysin [Flavobacteriales bacterium]|jgi:putative hemolysin